jgi:hypothetical protein
VTPDAASTDQQRRDDFDRDEEIAEPIEVIGWPHALRARGGAW